MLIISQGYCVVGWGLSGLHWVWCNGIEPHLYLRRETQGSYPFLTLITGLEQESQASSSVEEWISACLSSCSRGDRPLVELYLEPTGFFLVDATGVSVPLRVVTLSTGLHSKRCPGIRFVSRVDGEISVFWNVTRPTRLRLELRCETGLLLRCDGKVGIPFQTKQGNRPSCGDQEGRRGSH